MTTARDARTEAFDRLGGDYEVRVLEPAPPAVLVPGTADDPVARGDVPAGRTLVSPVSTGDVFWEELARDDVDLADWCAQRWLAALPRLHSPPPGYAATRSSLHLVAEHVMSPTRARDQGEITLRWTLGGFGTPFFGSDSQVRIAGDQLVVQQRDQVTSQRLTTLTEAAHFVGFDVARLEGLLPDAELAIDVAAAEFLSNVHGFAFNVLEELRAESHALDPSFVNLWPEQFDVVVELGVEQSGHRFAYGVSPGDDAHDAPYLFVAPWSTGPEGRLVKTATSFTGAELSWAQLTEASDQRATALEFFRAHLLELNPPRD